MIEISKLELTPQEVDILFALIFEPVNEEELAPMELVAAGAANPELAPVFAMQ